MSSVRPSAIILYEDTSIAISYLNLYASPSVGF